MAMNKRFQLLALPLSVSLLVAGAALPAEASAYVKPTKISAVTAKKTVHKWQEFELKVKMKPYHAEDDYLHWSIVKGKNIIQFEDDDHEREGDDMEFIARKKGKATVRCKIRGTKKKVDFHITVR